MVNEKIQRRINYVTTQEIIRMAGMVAFGHINLKELTSERNIIPPKEIFSYRTINSWSDFGLIDDNRIEQGKGWRKFSKIEFAYILILKALRDFDISLAKLKIVKDF